MFADLHTTARMLVRSGVRQRYPHPSQDEIDRGLAALLYGKDVSSKFFGG